MFFSPYSIRHVFFIHYLCVLGAWWGSGLRVRAHTLGSEGVWFGGGCRGSLCEVHGWSRCVWAHQSPASAFQQVWIIHTFTTLTHRDKHTAHRSAALSSGFSLFSQVRVRLFCHASINQEEVQVRGHAHFWGVHWGLDGFPELCQGCVFFFAINGDWYEFKVMFIDVCAVI